MGTATQKNFYISRLYQYANFGDIIIDDVEPMTRLRDNKDAFRRLVIDAQKDIYIFSGIPFYDFETEFIVASLSPLRRYKSALML